MGTPTSNKINISFVDVVFGVFYFVVEFLKGFDLPIQCLEGDEGSERLCKIITSSDHLLNLSFEVLDLLFLAQLQVLTLLLKQSNHLVTAVDPVNDGDIVIFVALLLLHSLVLF